MVVRSLGDHVTMPPESSADDAPVAVSLDLELGAHLLSVTVPVSVPLRPVQVTFEAAKAGVENPTATDVGMDSAIAVVATIMSRRMFSLYVEKRRNSSVVRLSVPTARPTHTQRAVDQLHLSSWRHPADGRGGATGTCPLRGGEARRISLGVPLFLGKSPCDQVGNGDEPEMQSP